MASCVLRKLATQNLKFNQVKNSFVCLQALYKRSIHVSSLNQQKYFTDKHEWIDVSKENIGTVGITDYAQDKLGDVVYIQLPEVGQALESDGEAGVLESVKAASDIFSPVSGEVTEVNNNVADNPGLINSSPYDNGWLYKMTVGDAGELEKLMDEAGYNVFLKNLD